MKSRNVIMRTWMLCGGVILLGGMLFWVLFGALLGHNPNHDINMDEARKAANRVHPTPEPGIKIVPGAGG